MTRPRQVDSAKNKNNLCINQKQSVQFVQAALWLPVTDKQLSPFVAALLTPKGACRSARLTLQAAYAS